jgi:hypothetical protein
VTLHVLAAWGLTAALGVALGGPQGAADAYLSWSLKQAQEQGQQAYRTGRVGGIFDTRLLKTDRSYNYKLAATWFTSDVIRATARVIQLRDRLSDADTTGMVQAAERAGGTVVMVEIDPREGSGVIPSDWQAFLQPKDRPEALVRGTARPELREVRALAGVLRRNYDYDRFWVTFPLKTTDGRPLFGRGDRECELVVRIHDKEGRVNWPIPASMRGE